MDVRRRRLLRSVVPLAATLAAPWPARSQANWPSAPIRLVVPFPPGGASDIAARVLAQPLGEVLGQTLVVENKPGGGATIGARQVAQAPADGYTLLMSNSASSSISPFVIEPAAYDTLADFTHVYYVGAVPTVFVTHPSVPARTLPELIAWIRAEPQPVLFGSGGVASVAHVVGELFGREIGVKLEHVPYKGSAPMRTDLLGGQIRFAIDALPQNLPFLASGELRLIAVTAPQRVPQAPAVPSVGELGLPRLVAENFVGISGPHGLPPAVADRLTQALDTVLAHAEVRGRLEELGFVLAHKSSSDFTRFIEAQAEAWGPVVRGAGASV